MPSKKDRLYVALYARGGAPSMPGLKDTCFNGPDINATGPRPHRQSQKPESTSISLRADTPSAGASQNLNCVEWVREAFEAAVTDGNALGTCASDWKSVRDAAMWYVETKKAAHRFDGTVPYDQSKAATWDMLEGVELAP
ncbi:hypothetical protein XA68_16443 [Ophiocordyceps unilateralis]|uniref:Uncharacterized protein n=1 Tax=Ophiocordyceps unilateralis TaxID=268505 RepID=A0A2A9PLF6_OPHUN|nr:hypothetical protein XA68_16443 [Ophiocordyceps unilateralis]